MNNRYFEYGVMPKNENREKTIMTIFKVIKIIFILLLFVIGVFAFTFYNEFWILFAFLLTIVLVLHYFQCKFYNFYDFVFVDGRVSISKIINNKRRKQLISFECKTIEKIGFLDGETCNKYVKDKNVKKIYVTYTLVTKDVCFLLNTPDKKTLILFPFNEHFLVQVLKYSGNNKLDKNFIDNLKV